MADLSETAAFPFICEGGLVANRSTFIMQPGQAIQLENFDLTARHGVLKSLSEKYGGKMVYPNELDSLATEILESDALKPIVFQSSKTQSIMQLRWLFFLLAGMLVLEWFIRRYMGSY